MPPKKGWGICENCGKDYYGYGKRFCSQSCRSSTLNKERPTPTVHFKCPECGETEVWPRHKARKQMYCSRECAARARARKHFTGVHRICVVCGEKFSLNQCDAKRKAGLYCSKDCYGQAVSKREVRKCAQCGNKFTAYAWAIKDGNGIYCSKECAGLASRTGSEQECEHCGTVFWAKKSVLDKGEGRFCSKKCHFSHRGETNIERLVREALEQRNVEFKQEKQFKRWTADFYLPSLHVVIEADGEYWHSLEKAIKAARRKDAYLHSLGIKVYRFAEKDILNDVDSLVECMLDRELRRSS